MVKLLNNERSKLSKIMIQIRKATQDDYLTIAHFQILMAKETEQLQLDENEVIKGVLSVMKDSGKGQYYVAEENGQLVSSLMITYEWSDWRSKWIWWIQSVYVIPEKRKQGVFQMMYQNIKKRVMADREVSGLRLYVDNTNVQAIKVYNKMGMNGDHYRLFEWMK